MVSKKYIIVLAFLVVIGGVIAVTWTGTDSPETPESPNSTESTGLNGSGYGTGDLPVGVTIDGIVVSPLVDEHQEILSQSTFSLTTVREKTQNNETQSVRTVYKKGETAVHISKRANGEILREQYYDLENKTVYLCDQTRPEGCPTAITESQNTTTYEVENTRAMFLGGDWLPRDVNENATYTEVTLQSTKMTVAKPLSKRFALTNITSFSGNATVDERQIITKLDVSANGDVYGQSSDFKYQSTVTGVNQTVVSQPQWVSNAQTQQPAATHGASQNDRSMYVTNTNNEPYEAGTTLQISIEKGDTYERIETTLENELKSGDTLYIVLIDGQIKAYQNKAPDQQGDKLTEEAYVLRLITPDGTPETNSVEVVP